MKKYLVTSILLLFVTFGFGQQSFIQFVYVSDSHYGIERDFRGKTSVSASKVNRAMIDAINSLPGMVLPRDGGVKEAEKIAWVDYVINTGDITNRAEKGIPRSARSWRQFKRDWSGLKLVNIAGVPTPQLLLPGNHDISNAIGHPSIPRHKVDATAAAEIYNAMLRPDTLLSKRAYNRDRHLCNYAFCNSNVHFVFLDMWPDTRNRTWLKAKLQTFPKEDVCLLFVHDQPDIEARHLINPNGARDINTIDRFENLAGDVSSVSASGDVPVEERRQLQEFLGAHPVIRGYFHGNENYNEFYTWGKPVAKVSFFRVDSPMKGAASSKNEAQLSFQFVVIDTEKKVMTVREFFWNRLDNPVWGETITVRL
ncbi:metallophosphoesterase family protein [Bacteroides sp. UBA939]|uniref:metallophosphoesterase family protein n=1 Tax=Bacteroides sp. UBA939 TaxID=1946092 RepID=UPI0025C02269|nr:metallophosphoesterase [Bacteroides sp. UBA939]